MQFYLNENSTHFGCREGDSFVLLCLSLAALKRCFANHVQRLQLPHHLSRSPGNVCLPPSVWQSNLCPAGCLLKAEQPNSLPPNSFSSQFSAKPVAELQSQFIDFSPGFMCHRTLWQLKSLTSGKGKAHPASEEKTGMYFQGSSYLPSGRQIKQKLPYPNCFCTKWTLLAVLQKTAPHAATSRHPMSQENTSEMEITEKSLFSFYTLLLQLGKWH